MKRFILVTLLLALVPAITLAAFAKATSAAEPLKLTFSTHIPAVAPFSKNVLMKWASGVEEATKGRIKIKFFWAGALGPSQDQYEISTKGIADISLSWPYRMPGRFPLTTVMELPFLYPSTAAETSRIAWELAEKHMAEEYGDVKLLMMGVTSGYDLFFAKKRIHTLEDLVGTKVIAGGEILSKYVEYLGAVPTPVTAAEFYHALERGVADGIITSAGAFNVFKLHEVIKHKVDIKVSYNPVVATMNLKTWSSLPPDIQEKIMSVSGIYGSEMIIGRGFDIEDETMNETIAKSAIDVYFPPPAELKKWKNRVMPIYDWWLKDMEAPGKGQESKKLLEDARRLGEKYTKR